MKKYIWPLTLMLITLAGAGAVDYVKTASARGRLVDKLNEAAEVASAYPPDSAEAQAATERGTLIALGWPCNWWEDQQAVRSRISETFENLIARKRESQRQTEGAAKPSDFYRAP
jgi:hypothetical protein